MEQGNRVEHKLALTAAGENKKMTFDELRAFVQAATRAEVPDDALVKATTTMSGHIKRVEIG